MVKRWRFSEQGNNQKHHEFHKRLHRNFESGTSNDIYLKPPGYVHGNFDNEATTSAGKEDRKAILQRQAWNLATSPSKQILMSGLMMWLSGSQISIISLMMMAMVMLNPIKSLFAVNSEFAKYESKDRSYSIILQKLTFIACNFASVLVGVWKLNSLGLLPTMNHMPPTVSAPNFTEFSAGMIIR